ncbi:peptidase M4 [Alkalibacillus aidingensis]|uniref:peptidase M4 n=1 Tax=Alkalibacillus aidingensis TaxID=2747607 RepID=UPI001660C6ED|nr:peptidase M4 [Alkalibacillus aidingensis]
MKWYKLIVPAAIGLLVGAIVARKVKHQLLPEIALKRVKEHFAKEGPISGSWIMMEQEEYERDGQIFHVYKGGITRTIDGEKKQYTFYVNASDGHILEITNLN